MNHNPDNFKEGDKAMLDSEYNNSTIVIVDWLSRHQIFARVYTEDKPEEKWEIMTTRLSPITKT